MGNRRERERWFQQCIDSSRTFQRWVVRLRLHSSHGGAHARAHATSSMAFFIW